MRDKFYPCINISHFSLYRCHTSSCSLYCINGLQVNGGGVFDREFTKILIIRDFDDVLKNPFRYVHLFLLHTLLSKKNFENRHARPVTRGSKVAVQHPSPPLNEGLALIKPVFFQPALLIRNT